MKPMGQSKKRKRTAPLVYNKWAKSPLNTHLYKKVEDCKELGSIA